MDDRKNVIKEIKTLIVPELRILGFVGSYPHFRRKSEEGYDLISFQFNRYGGSFLIEMSVAYPERIEYKNCYLLGIKPFEEEIKKLNTGNTYARYRVSNEQDEWFSYEGDNIKQLILKAWNHLQKNLNWFENPLIYNELNDRKKNGFKY